MTRLALTFSAATSTAWRAGHAETTRQMFPGYRIHAITNGVHVDDLGPSDAFREFYQSLCPQWAHEPELLVRADHWSDDEIWRCSPGGQGRLCADVAQISGENARPERCRSSALPGA